MDLMYSPSDLNTIAFLSVFFHSVEFVLSTLLEAKLDTIGKCCLTLDYNGLKQMTHQTIVHSTTLLLLGKTIDLTVTLFNLGSNDNILSPFYYIGKVV